MRAKDVLRGSAIIAAAAAVTACSGGGGGGGSNGSLSLQLTDASVDNVSQINIEITGLKLKPQGGNVIDIPFKSPLDVDMLTLTNGNSTLLLNGEQVPAGQYNWMELEVDAANSNVVTATGGQVGIGGTTDATGLSIPSGSQTGLRLVSGFTVTADQASSFEIDWNMRMGLTQPVGRTGYFLRPALRLIDMTKYGTLTGTVAKSLLDNSMSTNCTNDLSADTGNAVYIYDPFDTSTQTPDDIGGATGGPLPIATATVKQQPNGDYTYETLLSPGDYTVAFTCQASGDDPTQEDGIAFQEPQDVTVTDGGTPVVSFQ